MSTTIAINIFTLILMVLIIIKSLTIGSDFNFHYLWKYGKKYRNWYFNRETFEQHLEHLESRPQQDERPTCDGHNFFDGVEMGPHDPSK